MSGGSWNYVYMKIEAGEAVEPQLVRDMAQRVKQYGPECWKVSRNMEVAAELLEAARVLLRPTGEVWRAVEWHDSCDSGPEEVIKACRDLAPQPPPPDPAKRE